MSDICCEATARAKEESVINWKVCIGILIREDSVLFSYTC